MHTSGYTLTERLNRIPVLTTRHKVWSAVLAGLLIFEMADLNAFAYVAPTLRQQWGLSVDAVALISASAFLGMSLGAVIGGILADRFGRKRLLVWGTVFYSGLSILSATSSGPVQLAAYRFFIGAGLYAVTVAALTYVAEMFPRNHRGKVQSLLLAVALLGIPLMSWLSRWVVPMSANGWRWVFVAGGSGLVVAVVASRLLPESVRWLEQHSGAVQTNDGEDIVADIERRSVHITGTDLPVPVNAPAAPVGTASDLVRSGYLKRAVVMSVTLAFATSAFYGYNSWMPVLLTEHGFSTDSSLTYTSILAVAACPGALLAFLFIERVERRTAIMAIYLLTAILLVVFGTTESDLIFALSGVAISLLLYCNTAMMYTYMPEIFPTQLRALGTGIPNSVGRLATVVCMFAVAAILSQMGFTSVFVFLAAAAALAALVIGVFGERTRGRTLEDISAINGGSADPSTRTQTVPAQEVEN
ncbi:MFS transporter [Rhodococcus sp. NPDC019627]|uniref:MFS transporter n=1 Tax=unclassified Rhodococcus (in: high G+C Gram-positive bacteria) TaxID=192944 RepID=UPI0033D7DFEC